MDEKEHWIDCEPKWENIVPLYCEWLEYGTDMQKEIAKEELKKIAVVADIVRQAQKQAKKDGKKEATLVFKVD